MRTKEEILRETINDKKYRFVDHITNETLEAVLEAMQIYADQFQEPKQEERYTHCGGNCKNSTGETSVMCCNYCGLPTEKSWSIGKNIYFNPIEPKQREVSFFMWTMFVMFLIGLVAYWLS